MDTEPLKKENVVDPHWFQCRSGSSFLFKCDSGSGSKEPTNANPCGFKSQVVYFAKFVKFSCSWIRIRIRILNPDPGQPNECGTGSTTLHKCVQYFNLASIQQVWSLHFLKIYQNHCTQLQITLRRTRCLQQMTFLRDLQRHLFISSRTLWFTSLRNSNFLPQPKNNIK